MSLMSHTAQEPVIPEWTLDWRMQRALSHAGIGVEEMANELGVARQTVSRWLNGHGASPRIGYLKLWAMRCGVPLAWLVDGDESAAQRSAAGGPRNELYLGLSAAA